MEATKTGYSSHDWKAAVDELTRGRDLASQLGAMLEDALPTSTSRRDLLREISDSFSRALAVLDVSTAVKSEDAHGSQSRELPGKKRKPELSGQRGGYRRSRRVHSSCKSVTTATLNDGHAWRKYGQKAILNSKSPRGYYRCTHKKDQMCLATRHVQQSEDNPSLFVITYIGEHTCQELAETLASLENDPCIIDFSRSSYAAATSSNPPSLQAMRQESDEDGVSSALVNPGSSSSGYFAMPELDMLDESARLVEELKGGASEHGDVTSCLQASSVDDFGWNLGDEYSFDINCIFDYNQGDGGTLY
ncbi:putative WRKY transcription factor 70 [Iris pallida]|uniref:WRKY transcription factor 70 n=1 Tax=Iris pallida TaxID=29817 RepID=A0AAX6HLZ1_IRIPA|nr:putative WRKY transcription factor 70 [Iris pallida]